MTYYDHATMMALRLGIWSAPPRIRPYEAEIQAQRAARMAAKKCEPSQPMAYPSDPGGAEKREIAKKDQNRRRSQQELPMCGKDGEPAHVGHRRSDVQPNADRRRSKVQNKIQTDPDAKLNRSMP